MGGFFGFTGADGAVGEAGVDTESVGIAEGACGATVEVCSGGYSRLGNSFFKLSFNSSPGLNPKNGTSSYLCRLETSTVFKEALEGALAAVGPAGVGGRSDGFNDPSGVDVLATDVVVSAVDSTETRRSFSDICDDRSMIDVTKPSSGPAVFGK